MKETSFILLYKSMVHPHLEYANSVWCPYKMGDIKEIEKVQKRATKLIINLKSMSYINRLLHLKLPTLKYRRLREDMIEVFKITHEIYDSDASLKLVYHSVININFSTKDFIMICESTIFLHVLLIFGIVYLTTLWRLTLSTCLKHAWTGFGRTKMSNMISLPT